MAKQDPYKKGIADSVSDSLSPGFYKPSSSSLNNLENSASNLGRNTGIQHNTKSSDATGNDQSSSSATDQAAEAENNPTGLYNPTRGNDKTAAAADFAKNMASGNKLKALKSAKKAGPLGVLAVLLFVIGALLLGSSSLAPFAIANEIIDEFNSSNVSVRLRSHVLLKYHLKKGDTPEYTKKKLAAQGIEVETDADGREQLRFTDTDGTEHVVTADNFDDYRKNNASFRKAYLTASATWRGQSSGWFTKLASKTLKRIGVSRNNLKDVKNSDSSTEEERQKKLKEVVDDAVDKNSSDVDLNQNEENESDSEDDENKKSTSKAKTSNGGSVSSASASSTAIRSKINGFGLGTALESGCTAYQVGSVIKAMTWLSQRSEMLQIASIFLEAIQKTQAGEGEAAMLNTFMTALTTADDNGNSAMQSAGIAALFSGSSNSTTNYKDNASVKLANTNTIVTDAMEAAGIPADQINSNTYTACLAGRSAAAGINIVASVGGGIVGFIVGSAAGTIGNLVLGGLIDTLVNRTVESLNASANVLQTLSGEFLGNVLVEYSQVYLASVHQGQGGAAGSASAVAEYQEAKQEAIAEQAEYERSIYSPFDVSSQYTFLGSLLSSLVPLATSISSSSLGGTLSQTSSVISSSLISLTPAADAKNLTNLMQETGDCPDLESIGATCDMYGNPIYTSDLSTINVDPDTVATNASKDNYEKYQKYCEERTSSPLGTADSDIIADVTGSDSAISQWLSGVEVVGDVVEIANVALESANQGWITGQNCVDSSQNTVWDEMKWYQRYDEDQELEAQMNGEFSTSSSGTSGDGVYPGTKYDLSDDELKQLASIAACENGGTIEGVKFELSLMANLYEERGSNYSSILDYVKNGGWFASSSVSCASNEPSDENYQAAVDVIRNGNRTAPSGINEHDYIGDISYIELNGSSVDKYDINNYVQDQTIIHNTMGSTYTFWGWANPSGTEICSNGSASGSCTGDPFGYTGSSSGATSSLDSDLNDYELSNIIAYNPTEESSSDYYLAYDDDGNLSIEYYDDDATISDADGDGYDDDYVAEIASHSGFTTAEVVEALDLLYTEDDTSLTPAWPLATTTVPATTTIDFTNDAPLSIAVATSNHQYFFASPHTARTDLATTTA